MCTSIGQFGSAHYSSHRIHRDHSPHSSDRFDCILCASTNVEIIRDPVTHQLELRRVLPAGADPSILDLERRQYKYDRIINCLGFKFDGSLFDQDALLMDVRSNGKYPRMSSSFESLTPSFPGLYFAGGLQHARDWRKSSGGFIHGFRYSVRVLFQMLQLRHHGVAWPTVQLPATLRPKFDLNNADELTSLAEPLASWLLDRANVQSSIYQLFGQLSEVMVVHGEDDTNGVTVEYLKDGQGAGRLLYTCDIVSSPPAHMRWFPLYLFVFCQFRSIISSPVTCVVVME
jgi:hypothetical protein